MDIYKLRDHLRSAVNWNAFFSNIETIGDMLNSQKDRFDKSDLIEKSLETFSNGSIKYINENGADHTVTIKNKTVRMEMKFAKELFYGLKRDGKSKRIQLLTSVIPPLKRTNVKLTLFNSKGTNRRLALPESYSPYLLAVDEQSVYLIETSKLVPPYLKINGDSIETDIPPNMFENVINPANITKRIKIDGLNYKEDKDKLQSEYLNKILESII